MPRLAHNQAHQTVIVRVYARVFQSVCRSRTQQECTSFDGLIASVIVDVYRRKNVTHSLFI